MTRTAKQGTLRDLEKQGISVGYAIVVSGAFPATYYDDNGSRTWTQSLRRAWASSDRHDAEECKRRVAYLSGLPLDVVELPTTDARGRMMAVFADSQDDDEIAPLDGHPTFAWPG